MVRVFPVVERLRGRGEVELKQDTSRSKLNGHGESHLFEEENVNF